MTENTTTITAPRMMTIHEVARTKILPRKRREANGKKRDSTIHYVRDQSAD